MNPLHDHTYLLQLPLALGKLLRVAFQLILRRLGFAQRRREVGEFGPHLIEATLRLGKDLSGPRTGCRSRLFEALVFFFLFRGQLDIGL